MKTLLSMIAAATVLASGAAFAAENAAKSDASAAKAKPAVTQTTSKKNSVAAVQSEKSKKCSDEANTKNLHGKARKAFRKACMKAA